MPIKLPPTPDIYEDPLGLLDPDLVPLPDEARPLAVPTGLSEEDDAGRWLGLKFNAVMCWNCETVYDPEVGKFCPRCAHPLLPPAEAIAKGANRKKRFGA